MFNLWSAFEEISKDIITYGHGVYYETEGEKQMNKEQKIQKLTEKIENFQAEIDELKEELERLQKKPYEISYPEPRTKMYYINDYTGEIHFRVLNVLDSDDKHLYDIGLYFDTKEEAEQFKRERALIKKIKCWAKEQQGDWQPNWNDGNETKHHISFENNRLSIWHWYTNKLLIKLPCFKSQEIAQACIDEFGEEIIEVFC